MYSLDQLRDNYDVLGTTLSEIIEEGLLIGTDRTKLVIIIHYQTKKPLTL